MNKITISINTDSAAFEDLGIQDQLKFIFDQITEKLQNVQLETGDTLLLYDYNGNNVGILDTF